MIKHTFKHLTKEERNIMEQMSKQEIYIRIDILIEQIYKAVNNKKYEI